MAMGAYYTKKLIGAYQTVSYDFTLIKLCITQDSKDCWAVSERKVGEPSDCFFQVVANVSINQN